MNVFIEAVLVVIAFFIAITVAEIVVEFFSEHDIWQWIKDRFKSHEYDTVYIVRKSHTDLYLKEDYSYSRLGEGLAPLLFYSVDSARQTMELLEWEVSNWMVMETSKDILSNVVSWSRSEKPKKENFHKFKIDDRLSINENREANGIEPITRRCANCDQSSEWRGEGMYCFEHSRFMSPNGCCESWGGREENA